MQTTRAFAHLRLGQFEDAANWMVKAAGRPNAHIHVICAAASCLALVNRMDEAQGFTELLRRRDPSYGFSAFRARSVWRPTRKRSSCGEPAGWAS